MGPDMVGCSLSTFFRQGSGCLCPHHFGIFGMLIWLYHWKKKCAACSSLEATRIWGKRVLFCMAVLPCRKNGTGKDWYKNFYFTFLPLSM
jgi:hypothetical protein